MGKMNDYLTETVVFDLHLSYVGNIITIRNVQKQGVVRKEKNYRSYERKRLEIRRKSNVCGMSRSVSVTITFLISFLGCMNGFCFCTHDGRLEFEERRCHPAYEHSESFT